MKSCRIHLMGIYGSGMRSMALWFASRGYTVSGCDMNPSETDEDLSGHGITVFHGHDPQHLKDVDTVVFSAAIPWDNPELQAAILSGVTVMRRSEALAELANSTRMLAVAGTHGKTTTTAMTGWILQEAGQDPTVMVGGRIRPWGGNFRKGSDISVVEADEYDRTFLRLRPFAAGVTSLSPEHLECYGSPEALSVAFGVFLEMTVPGGTVVVPTGLLHLARWAERIGRTVVTTGPSGDIFCQSTGSHGWTQEYSLGHIKGFIELTGEYNLRNAETAIALAQAAGVSPEDSVRALESFPGVQRRLERLGELGGAVVLSDYAHHPEEVKAAIGGLATMSLGRIGVVFQPHLYTRTAAFASEFASALSEAAWSIILPIYPAREKPLPGVTSELITEAARLLDSDTVLCSEEDLQECLEGREADYIVFMGAGSIDEIARRMIAGGGPDNDR